MSSASSPLRKPVPEESAPGPDWTTDLSPERSAELRRKVAEGLAEADRGELISKEEFEADVLARYGLRL